MGETILIFIPVSRSSAISVNANIASRYGDLPNEAGNCPISVPDGSAVNRK